MHHVLRFTYHALPTVLWPMVRVRPLLRLRLIGLFLNGHLGVAVGAFRAQDATPYQRQAIEHLVRRNLRLLAVRAANTLLLEIVDVDRDGHNTMIANPAAPPRRDAAG